MSKTCAIDGQKIGMMTGKVQVENQWVCENHLKQAGFNNAIDALKYAKQFNVATLQQYIAGNYNLKQAILQQQNQQPNSRLAEIQAQFKAAGVSDLFGTKKEVKALPDILQQNEVVKYATSGLVDGNTVLMVLTNTRILFIDKGLIYGIKSTEIPLNMINSVSYSMGMLLGSITITNGAVTTGVKDVSKETAPIMVDRIKTEMANFQQYNNQRYNQQPMQNNDIAEQLRQYKSLLDEGIITEAEFNAKKQQLLGL